MLTLGDFPHEVTKLRHPNTRDLLAAAHLRDLHGVQPISPGPIPTIVFE